MQRTQICNSPDLGKAAFDNNPNYYKLSFSSSEHKRLEAEARVAIEAIRLPTDNMLAAMDDSQSDRGKWHDAIDAALKE